MHASELDQNDGVLELTPNVKVWNPKDPEYSIQEESMVDFRGEIKEQKQRSFVILAVLERCCDPHLCCEDFLSMVISVVRLKDGGVTLKPSELSEKWNISEKMARKTIQATTRLCPRNTLDISLNKRFDQMIRYRHLPVTMYSDTMFALSRIGSH